MCALLDAALPFVRRGVFRGIRLSTRPDCVDEGILAALAGRSVTAVELGAQSMDDAVLVQNGRGHTAADVERAAGLIRARGLSLGLQMMTGLPGSTPDTDRETAARLAALRPDTMRIYPTVALRGTPLDGMVRSGAYIPPTLEETVALCAELLLFFEEERDIPVIRLGLHASPDLDKTGGGALASGLPGAVRGADLPGPRGVPFTGMRDPARDLCGCWSIPVPCPL